ncbi:MAG: MerR family transcriptional regulator [Anaerolineae bacterium]|nr:MerR family transcriptional regulator [Anaerolineae bacterium]
MSEQTTYHAPQAVTGALDISSATLRRWSQRFGDYLSPEASGSDAERSHRRYTDDDLATLRVVKELMNNGLTYEQVLRQLALNFTGTQEQMRGISPEPVEDDAPGEGLAEERSLIASNGNESAAVAFLTNTLATLSDNQKSILNSQAANRELMGVLIQDNFNLKEENNRLRERILEVERSLAQSRQEGEWQREALRQELDAKIATTQQLATEAMVTAQATPAPDIKAVKSKPGCLGSLLGLGGDVQIVSVPRPRDRRADGRPAAPAPALQQPSRPHPKPTAPPE